MFDSCKMFKVKNTLNSIKSLLIFLGNIEHFRILEMLFVALTYTFDIP